MGLNVEKIREDFPALHQLKNAKPIIYADSACMALKPQKVIDALLRYYTEHTSCAGRSPHAFSLTTTKLYDDARKELARFINAKDPAEVVWTRNTTESLNLGSRCLKYDGSETIITTSESHNSNLVKWIRLKNLGKLNLKIIKMPLYGVFDLEELTSVVEMCEAGKFLASLNHISNVTAGHIPVEEIGKIIHEKDGILQLDAAQGFPHTPINVQKMGVDLLGASMHKACGPTGMGFLYGRYNLLEEIEPLILGGETVSDVRYPDCIKLLNPPARFEAGLQNYAGTIASGAAIQYLASIGMKNIATHEKKLSRIMLEGLNNTLGDKIRILGPENPEERVALAAIDLKGINPHEVAILMDEMKNIFLRSGMHCAHAYHHALGLNEGTLRPSWYLYNTVEEVNIFIETLNEIVEIMT
ncbi:MAG: aminotransferase class V-fold PLP-dependent enzyme [Candidatus Hodarchaeales archaeon]|jgi:cysteine desulfurase/selenocysteine lyase